MSLAVDSLLKKILEHLLRSLSQYILYGGLARLHAIRYVHLQQLCKVHTIGKSSLSHERSTRLIPALLICSYWSTTCKITCQPYPQDSAHSTPTVLVTFQLKTSGRWPCVVPWRASCAAHLEKECVCVCVCIVTFSPAHSKLRPSRISLESWNADSAPLLVFAVRLRGGCDPLT